MNQKLHVIKKQEETSISAPQSDQLDFCFLNLFKLHLIRIDVFYHPHHYNEHWAIFVPVALAMEPHSQSFRGWQFYYVNK